MAGLGLQGGGDLAALLPGAGAPPPAGLPPGGDPLAGIPIGVGDQQAGIPAGLPLGPPAGLPAPPQEALLPSGLSGAAPGLEQENDDVGLELIDLVSALQSAQISEQGELLTQLLESLGIGGAEQNPLDGASLGSALETPDAGNAGVAQPAPGGIPDASLSAREPSIGGGLDIAGALGL